MSFPLTVSAVPITDTNLPVIQAILKKPDAKIDLARAKLTIDRMIDPTINIESNLKRLDSMVDEIKAMMPVNPASLQKMETLVTYIYKPGAWND